MEHFDVVIIGGGSAGLARTQATIYSKKAGCSDRGWKDSWLKECIRRNSLFKEAKEW